MRRLRALGFLRMRLLRRRINLSKRRRVRRILRIAMRFLRRRLRFDPDLETFLRRRICSHFLARLLSIFPNRTRRLRRSSMTGPSRIISGSSGAASPLFLGSEPATTESRLSCRGSRMSASMVARESSASASDVVSM